MAKRIQNLNCPKQIGTEWCWAAITEGILRFHGEVIDQFQIASRFLNRSTCGSGTIVRDICNQPKSLALCLSHNRISPNETPVNALNLSQIKQTLQANRPVCLRIEYNRIDPVTNQRRAHFLLVCGFTDNNLLLVQNPDPMAIDHELALPYPFFSLGLETCQITHVYLTDQPVPLLVLSDSMLVAQTNPIVPDNWWSPGRRRRSIRVFGYNEFQQAVVHLATWKLIVEDRRILYVDVWSPDKKPRKLTRLTHSSLLNSVENRLLMLSSLPAETDFEICIWNDVLPGRQSVWLLSKRRNKSYDDVYPPVGQFLPLFQSISPDDSLKPFDQLV